jgi:hypothetical protein
MASSGISNTASTLWPSRKLCHTAALDDDEIDKYDCASADSYFGNVPFDMIYILVKVHYPSSILSTQYPLDGQALKLKLVHEQEGPPRSSASMSRLQRRFHAISLPDTRSRDAIES